MKLVKLDAIDSTNDFLKGLIREHDVENFTVITAEDQTKGKGQMGSVWVSEKGKNLIMSVLVADFLHQTKDVFNLNMVVSLAVIRSLQHFKIPELSIKWPNDILSGNKKIGGILIENSFKSNDTIFSVVGIGLNVNQTNFDLLPNAASLALVTHTNFDKEKLLVEIVENIKSITKDWENHSDSLRENYIDLLFKNGIMMPFQKQDGQLFNGTIQGISDAGRLLILSEEGQLFDFDIKEIQMLY